MGTHNSNPPVIGINQINFSQRIGPIISSYPSRDWYIIERVAASFSNKWPKSTFRTIGWLSFIGQRWIDIVQVKKMEKQTDAYISQYSVSVPLTF